MRSTMPRERRSARGRRMGISIRTETSSLWIRADCIRVYDYFQTHYNTYAKFRDRAPGGVLTEQTCIGESHCVASSVCTQVRA
jgi:hypothetical protein